MSLASESYNIIRYFHGSVDMSLSLRGACGASLLTSWLEALPADTEQKGNTFVRFIHGIGLHAQLWSSIE